MTGEQAGILYALVVVVHVGTAMVWVGGDITVQLLVARAHGGDHLVS